jgi:hypothetical protein
MSDGPRLSVVLVSRTGIAESTPVLRQFRRQTIIDDIEVLWVAPRGCVSADDLDGFGFPRARIIAVDRVENRGFAAAAGVRAASAPFVALAENHSFPAPENFEVLVGGWGERDAGIAPVITSANATTRRSLASLLLFYGEMAAPGHDGPRDALPYHNAVYRTAQLKAFGADLDEMLAEESRLHDALRAAGFELRQRPAARNWHINETRWRRVVGDPFVVARRYGAHRGQGWSLGRRALYVAAFPALAGLRLRQLLQRARAASDLDGRLLSLIPLLAFLALVSAVGEAMGYLDLEWTLPGDFNFHEFDIRNRLAGVPPSEPWIRALIDALPETVR